MRKICCAITTVLKLEQGTIHFQDDLTGQKQDKGGSLRDDTNLGLDS